MSDTEKCPDTQRSPISEVSERKQLEPFTVDGMTVLAYTEKEAQWTARHTA